jgi:hypothetical protein
MPASAERQTKLQPVRIQQSLDTAMAVGKQPQRLGKTGVRFGRSRADTEGFIMSGCQHVDNLT